MVEIDARRTNHPYTVTAVEDAPDPLPHLIRQNLPAGEGVEAVFVIPPEVYARGYRAHLNPLQALVFTHTRVLHVSESEQAGTWIAAEDILKVKMSMVLLYGLLEIWAFHGGEPSKIQVEYNTVSQRFLSPLIKAVLRQTWNKNPPQPAPAVEDPTFPQLLDMSYSFYNGLTCEALQPGEVVTRYVYQPELHASRLKVGQRKVYPQTLCALTDRQIILLQQDLKYKKHHEWIFTFIPRYRISHQEYGVENGWSKTTLHLDPDQGRENIVLLSAPQDAPAWQSLWEEAGLKQPA